MAGSLEALTGTALDFTLSALEQATRTQLLDSVASLPALRERLFGELESPATAGEPWTSFQRLIAVSPGVDVVMVDAGAVVESGWLERLRDVAYEDTVSASASALTSSQPPGKPNPGVALDGQVRGPAPLIEAPAWGAVYIRRDALNLAWRGETFNRSLLEELTDVLTAPGLVNRLAYDVIVHHARENGRIEPQDRPEPAVARALEIARGRASPLPVMIDARCLERPLSGTSVQVMSLARALAESGEAEVTILTPREIHGTNVPFLRPLGESVQLHTDGATPIKKLSVFHRPFQISSHQELAECLDFGWRFVLTQQDMILDRTPAYFASRDSWRVFRSLTAASLSSADQVGFFSNHAAADAATDPMLPREKVGVVPLGVDHLDPSRDLGGYDVRPVAELLSDTPFMLVLGHAYRHKNRLFALRLLGELISHGGWDGKLVLAGGEPVYGSSIPDERQFLEANPALRDHVVSLDHVNEGEKAWLYRSAKLVLFPTLYEGFGLVPFEAAAYGTPCVYAWRSALREFLPQEGGLLEGFDPAVCGDSVLKLLQDDQVGQRLVSATRKAAEGLTWERTAQGYLDVYRRALAAPARVLFPLSSEDGQPVVPGLSAEERRVIGIYRRRSVFRSVIERFIALGGHLTRLGRAVSRRAP